MFVPEAIQAFQDELASSGLAASTVYDQGRFVKRFGRVCADVARDRGKRSPLQVGEIDAAVISAYFATCKGRQGNRNQMTICLRKFLKWCELGRVLPAGETDRLLANRKYRKAERLPKHYVPVEQFPLLIESAERHPSDRAVMALALFTLCRSGEIADLRMKDIDLAENTIRVYREKRKRWTDIGITPELHWELTKWLGHMADELGYASIYHLMTTQPEWRVIPRLQPVHERNAQGRYVVDGTAYEMDPLNRQRHLERIVKRGLDVTGAQTADGRVVRHFGEGMHTIRRSGARAMLKHLSEALGNDRALVQVMTMLDHENTQITLAYIGMNEERDQLNGWLRGNSMYGSTTSARHLRAV